MPFTTHLGELRSCLIISFLALIAAFLGCFSFAEKIFSFLSNPLLQVQDGGFTLIGTGVSEALFTKLKVSLIASILLSSPVILWQAWRFIAPGLYVHERRYTRGFVFFGTLLFSLGAWFCYEVVFQMGFSFFLTRYEALDVRPAIRTGEYLSFASKMLLAFGIAFELPVVAYFLARVGLIDHLFLIRHFRYTILLIFLLAAILTPPDVVSQVLLALPLTFLYGISIGVAYWASQKQR